MVTKRSVTFAVLVFAGSAFAFWDHGRVGAQPTLEDGVQQFRQFGAIPAEMSAKGEVVLQGGGRSLEGESTPTFLVLISPDRTKAWGYSTAKGDWVKASLRDGLVKGTQPIVGMQVAVVPEGRRMHAFSSLTGEWQTLELPEGTDGIPVVGSDYAQVRTEETVSIFSAQKGHWSTLKFTE